MSKQHTNIHVNVIPLNLTIGELRCSFYAGPAEVRPLWPLNTYEMPEKAKALTSDEGPLYTDFHTHPDADLTLSIEAEESPDFIRHYLNYLIYQWFEDRARLRRKNFVNNNELYFLKEQDQRQGLAVFDRYTLRATMGRLTDGPELTVMYGGTMKVWRKSILAYEGRSRDFSKVVYKGQIHRYDELMEGGRIDRTEVYPVINREVARRLRLERPLGRRGRKINKLKRHTRHIDAFYEQWIQEEAFQERFQPSRAGYLSLKQNDLHRLSPRSADLLFGDGVVDKDPYRGLKKGGPYEPPRTSHIELFFIVDENDAPKTGNRLYTCLKEGIGHFPGLREFTRIPVYVSPRNITFRDSDNPLPEVKKKLRKIPFKEEVRYGALYISPIEKDEQDPKKHRVYYRMKEELLKYNITSQVINRKSVLDFSFPYYLPNIAVALVAKLGGTPWTLRSKQKKELVIGVGAFSPNRFRQTYLGSAFCFSNNGDFRGFDSFTGDDHLKLAGSFQKAILQFEEENSEIRRIVIHFYKRMSRKEASVIMGALRELKLAVPLIILTINKTGSRDLVLTDRSKAHCLPLSGTYYRSGHRQFLLCTNTRFDEGEKLKSHPYPIKIYIDLWGPNGERIEEQLEDEAWVRELIRQVYQFSRLNWQTVSTRSMPVTILYPEMVARKFPYFEGDIIPRFGKQNLWFL